MEKVGVFYFVYVGDGIWIIDEYTELLWNLLQENEETITYWCGLTRKNKKHVSVIMILSKWYGEKSNTTMLELTSPNLLLFEFVLVKAMVIE